MISEELDILKIVAQNPITSQRKIAEQTGISLGQVNFLLKKFAKKGLLKIEGQTHKSLQYNLTPKGLAEKTEKTLHYIKASYSVVQKLTARIKEVGGDYQGRGFHVYLNGSRDEMMDLCEIALREMDVAYQIGVPEKGETQAVVFYWEAEKAASCNGSPGVNLLD